MCVVKLSSPVLVSILSNKITACLLIRKVVLIHLLHCCFSVCLGFLTHPNHLKLDSHVGNISNLLYNSFRFHHL